MSAEKAAKLKLKKKSTTTSPYIQDAGNRLQPGAGVSLRGSVTGSWLDEIDLTGAEQMWRQILRAVHPDLTDLGWDSVPSLPEFSKQDVKNTNKKTGVMEEFNVGQEKIEWVTFPTGLPDHTSQQNSDDIEDNHAILKQSNASDLGMPSLTDLKAVECAGKVESRPHVDVVKLKSKPALKKTSTQHMRKSQLSGQRTLENLYFAKTLEDNKARTLKREKARAVHRPEGNDVVMLDLSEEDIEVRGPREQESEGAHRSDDTPGSLEKCPMCTMQFNTGFSQLDIDSHLAQCLANSAMDVMW
ncbi:Fanconi anemia core complex-associated protein 20 [Pelodytes ibericus]